jgi:hypothetical protein
MIKRYDVPLLLLVIVLSLLAALPILQHAGLPNGSDVLYHTYRVGEMARSWEHRMPFPRWAEGLYYGYGSPLWNFYASLSYYVTTGFVRYLSMTALDALRLLVVLSYLGMGVGMWAFVRRQRDALAGTLAAIAYVYSPYLIFTEPYARGTYPELLAFALFPIVMWRFSGLLRLPNGVNLAFASAVLYLLAISHNLMAISSTILLLGWLTWNAVATFIANKENRAYHLRPYLFSYVAVALGIGLSSYFWIPVVLEAGTVNIQNLTGVALLDYRNFFVPLGQMLQPMPLNDLGAINGLRNVYNLGVPQWIGAILGLITVILGIVHAIRLGRHDDKTLRQGVFFAGTALILLFLITPSSRFLWDNLRALQYLQFPWRFLGGVAFCLSFLVGMNAIWITRLPKWIGAGVAGMAVTVLVAFSIPAFTVPEWTNTSVDTSISAYHQSEISGLQRGTTFTDEYRPINVFTLPDANPSLLADYADGYPINKANVPEGVRVAPIENNPIWMEWLVTTPEDFTMEVYTFYWEGWRAAIDGQVVDITPSAEHGFITFPVPPGEHNIRVWLGSTPPRIFGNIVSAICLILTMALVAIRINNRYSFEAWIAPELSKRVQLGMWAGAGLAIGLALANPIDIFWRNSPPSTAPTSIPIQFFVGEDFEILGYDVNRTTLRPGDTLEVAVYWYPRNESSVNYSSFMHVGTLGLPPLAQQDKLHPAERVISEWWKPTGYIYDLYTIQLPSDMPVGEYDVLVGMYTCEGLPIGECGSGIRPSVTDAQGNSLGDVVPLLKIRVE